MKNMQHEKSSTQANGIVEKAKHNDNVKSTT